MTLRFVAAVLVAFLVVCMTSAATAGQPPALLTFSVNYRGLCIARADGTNAMRLTAGRDDRDAAWSPKGMRVAFARYYDEPRIIEGSEVLSDVLVADARGRVLRNVGRGHGAFNVEPAWSPNGRYIAFTAFWRATALVVADLRTGELNEIPGGIQPAWSPDGRLIANTEEISPSTGRYPPNGEPGIYVIRADGSGQRLLIPNGRDPAWSPNGRQIAYAISPPRAWWYMNAEIAVANADGSEPRLITNTPEPEADPAWSPGGRWLAFTRVYGRHETNSGKGAIIVARPDGSDERVVFRGARTDAFNPTWRSPRTLPRHKSARCLRR